MQVKGLSIQDIMNMDWKELNKLSAKDMRQLTSRLVSASNKRIRRLGSAKRGKLSFAYQSIEKRGKPFSIKGKNINQVREEFKETRQFLKMKTSTKKGWENYQKAMEKRVFDYTGGESLEWTDNTWSKYWKVYRELSQSYSGSITRKGTGTRTDSDRIQQTLTQIFTGNDKRHNVDYFYNIIERKFNELYETEQPEDETSPFEIDEDNEKLM